MPQWIPARRKRQAWPEAAGATASITVEPEARLENSGDVVTDNRRVCCFHDRVVGLADAKELLTLWTRSWQGFGWETMVLGMEHVSQHPLFVRFRDHVDRFYSRNVGNYDHLCWLRWLAFAHVGGGVMTDYDVINRCLVTQDIQPASPTIHELTRVPCCVAADAAGAEEIVNTIYNTPPPRERRSHFSDMVFFQSSAYPHVGTCVELGHDGWEEARCVHFSRHSARQWNDVRKTGTRREDLIRQLIPA